MSREKKYYLPVPNVHWSKFTPSVLMPQHFQVVNVWTSSGFPWHPLLQQQQRIPGVRWEMGVMGQRHLQEAGQIPWRTDQCPQCHIPETKQITSTFLSSPWSVYNLFKDWKKKKKAQSAQSIGQIKNQRLKLTLALEKRWTGSIPLCVGSIKLRSNITAGMTRDQVPKHLLSEKAHHEGPRPMRI